MTHGKTYNKSPRRINHKATKSKTNTGTTALERSVEQTTGGFKALLQLTQNIDCMYSLEPPRRGGSNEYPQSMFWVEIWKILEFFIWKFASFCL